MAPSLAERRSGRGRVLVALAIGLLLGGCESFAKGVTEAMLERNLGEGDDDRMCEAEGVPFQGIDKPRVSPFPRSLSWAPAVQVRWLVTLRSASIGCLATEQD